MVDFPPADLCIVLPDLPAVDDVCLPGGICLSYVWDGVSKIPHPSDMSLDFFSQLGPAMTPLVPIFNVVDTVLAIFKCVKAVPDAITSLDPSGLLDCLPALAKLVDQLIKFIPQMSIPKSIKAMLKNCAALLWAVANDFRYLQTQSEMIIRQLDRAATLNNSKMNGFLVCAQKDLDDVALSTAEALKGMGRIILLLNVFTGLIGAPEIPCFGSLIGDNLDRGFGVIIDLLLALAAVLNDIANAIPDPDMILAIALGDQQC